MKNLLCLVGLHDWNFVRTVDGNGRTETSRVCEACDRRQIPKIDPITYAVSWRDEPLPFTTTPGKIAMEHAEEVRGITEDALKP
jgi:hypothetical protein